jgi:hypothetical protein
MEGVGNATFLFEPTEQPEILAVSLKKYSVQFNPFILPIDVDKDGIFEAVEVKNLIADTSVIDLNASKGSLDLRNGDFKFDFVHSVSPKKHHQLKMLGIFGNWIVHDYGYINLSTGALEIHCNPFKIEEGSLSGFKVSGGATGQIQHWLYLKAIINYSGMAAPLCSSQGTLETIYICPGDEVFLCWNGCHDGEYILSTPSGDVTGLSKFGNYADKLPYFNILPPDAHPRVKKILYRITCVDENKTDTVDVVVCGQGGQEWTDAFKAKSDGYWRWKTFLSPLMISDKAKVTEIEFVKSTRGNPCADRNDYTIYHYLEPTNAKPDFQGTSNDWNFEINDPFYAVGWWEIKPGDTIPPVPRDTPYMCFKLKLECSDGHAPLPPPTPPGV